MNRLTAFCFVCSVALSFGCSQKEDASTAIRAEGSQPVAAAATPATGAVFDDHPDQVFWGDTHLHTSDSADAFAFGARLGAEDALRFARGEQVTPTTGLDARLLRPLDFLVIADHAVGLGIGQEIYDGNPKLIADPTVARWNKMFRAGGEQGQQATREIIEGHSQAYYRSLEGVS